MENILNQLSETYNIPMNNIKKSNISNSFIDSDMVDYFEESLYSIDSDDSYVYFFKNTSNRNSSTTIFEFFKAILNVKSILNTKNIKFFLIQDNQIKNFENLLKELSISLDKYSPDFDYILSDFEKCNDESLKKSIKLKIFTEIIKYIYKDSDLKDLMSMLVKNDKNKKNGYAEMHSHFFNKIFNFHLIYMLHK